MFTFPAVTTNLAETSEDKIELGTSSAMIECDGAGAGSTAQLVLLS